MSSPKILIIDDDRELNDLLSRYLPRHGYEVHVATHPDEGLASIRSLTPDLVVLDVMLPERSGFELCIEIRRFSSVPILMLTARGNISDRVLGLQIGADDYLPKPYEPRELAARIQSILRRTMHAPHPAASETPSAGGLSVLASGPASGLWLDAVKGVAYVDGRDVGLTMTEFGILQLLTRHPGVTVSREEITQQLRGIEWDAVDRSIDVLVSRLRHKLGDDSRQPRYLKTMWGDGYRFIGEAGEIR